MLRAKKSFVIIALLIGFILICAVGCGNNTANNKVEPDTEQGVESNKSEKLETLHVYSGAGLRKAMDEIGQVFEENNNVKIEYTYAGCGPNLAQMELARTGDVYVAGSQKYFEIAVEKGFTDSKQDIAYHIPVIGVPVGNPAGIEKLEDLAKSGTKIALGDEEGTAIGKIAKKMFKQNGLTKGIEANTIVRTATVNELVTYLATKQVDAALIFEDNVWGNDNVEGISIPQEKNIIKTIPVSVLKFSEKKEIAQQFADFIASDAGKAIFEKHGFKPVENHGQESL